MAPMVRVLVESEEAAVLDAVRQLQLCTRQVLITSSPAVNEGENFMSDVIRVDVIADDGANGGRVNICLLIKRMPLSKERRLFFQCEPAFANEATFYSVVLPFLQKYSKAELPALRFAPCLGVSPDFILLRHLSQDGFHMPDRKRGLNLAHCLLVLQELARFHAVSLAAKCTDPIGFDNMKSTLREWLVRQENPFINTGIDNNIHMSTKVADNPESSTVRELLKITGRGFDVLNAHIVPSEPLAVINHGDLWSNNLLFRYHEDSQTPTGVRFIDLQVSRYGCPSLDILYFLFTSGGSNVMNHHFHHLIGEYHKTLSDHLAKLAPSATRVSLQDIIDDMRKHSVLGLLMALLVMPVVTAENNKIDLNKMSENMLQNPAFQKLMYEEIMCPEYKRRVNEVFEFCDKENLIQI